MSMQGCDLLQDECACIGCKMCVWCASGTFRIDEQHGRSRVFAQWVEHEDKIEVVSCSQAPICLLAMHPAVHHPYQDWTGWSDCLSCGLVCNRHRKAQHSKHLAWFFAALLHPAYVNAAPPACRLCTRSACLFCACLHYLCDLSLYIACRTCSKWTDFLLQQGTDVCVCVAYGMCIMAPRLVLSRCMRRLQ